MSKVITNEAQLNTEVDDLVTEDYALEVLGLKNPADFRKFSRSFMKLSKIVKGIDDSNNNKLDKGGYNGTAKNINDELSKKATKTQLGRIIVGDNLTVDSNGKLSGTPPVDITGKLDKGTVPEKYNTAEKIVNELDKKASATELGRVKIGQNLSITADGVLNGNPAYTHPTGNGYSHLPVNGATGQFIKYSSAGNGQWAKIDWGDITGKPSTFTPTNHTHDDRYFTETEINDKLGEKLNKGAVSSEYDTAKKIEDKIKNIIDERWKILPKYLNNGDDLNNIFIAGFYISRKASNVILNNPIDDGAFELTVTGIDIETIKYTTQLLKDFRNNNYYIRTQSSYIPESPNWTEWQKITLSSELDTKVSKSGDTLTASLTIDSENRANYEIKSSKNNGAFGHDGSDYIYIKNRISGKSIILRNDGNAEYPANNLDTTSKEVVGAINGVNKILKGNSGIDNIQFIQDNIAKQKDVGYIDKVTGKLYIAKVNNNDISVTNNFMLATNAYLGSKFNYKYEVVTLGYGKEIKYEYNASHLTISCLNIDGEYKKAYNHPAWVTDILKKCVAFLSGAERDYVTVFALAQTEPSMIAECFVGINKMTMYPSENATSNARSFSGSVTIPIP